MESKVTFKPGMFHLLDITSEEAIRAMIERAKGYLTEFGGCPSASINNVAGVLQSMLGKKENKENAIDLFNRVLVDDPENINALENSRIVYDKLERHENAEACETKVRSLLEASESNLALSKTRCLAEQGLATTFNVSAFEIANDTGGDDFYRYEQSIPLFEKAFEADNRNHGVFRLEERLQWQFFLTQSYYHKFGHYLRMGSATDERRETFDKAIKNLVRVVRESSENKYQAKAWALMGTFFWKEAGTKEAGEPSSVPDCDLKEEYINPEICFRRATELYQEDPKILNRYARFLSERGNHQKAIQILDTSIRLDDSCNNWSAFATRGRAYKFMFLEQQKENSLQDENLLRNAKRDFEHLLKIHPNLGNRTRLAEILGWLGQEDQALKEFQYIIDHLDGQKYTEVHRQIGYCLRDSDPRRAIESFKRAVEIERDNLPKLSNAYNALQLLIRMYGDQKGLKHLLDEACYWLTKIDEKYKDQAISKLVRPLCEKFHWQMIRVSRRLIDQKRYSIASKCVPNLRGIDSQERQAIKQLETEIAGHYSNDSSANTPTGAEHCKVIANIRPTLDESRNRIKKDCDCLILHCAVESDANWVYYSLLPRLEESHAYKCCVPARDMGTLDFGSCVADMCCVIVILTPKLCGDAYCVDQLGRIVAEDSSRVFPVMLEKCDVPDILKDMRTIPYYSWEVLLRGIEEACGPR